MKPAQATESSSPIVTTAARVMQCVWFERLVIVSIVANAAVLAFETSVDGGRHSNVIGWLQSALVVVLALELTIRLLGHGARWRTFLHDGWTRFDVVILAASLLPAVGPVAAIARLARVLRVVRIVSVSPKLRLIVATMARSIPSLAHVGLLLGLLLFIYGVLGVYLFRDIDPTHWGRLGVALLTLFQMLTLEGWVELQRTSMGGQPLAWIFYGSFVLIAVFVVVNLFIAIVMSNLEQARRDLEDQVQEPTIADVLAELRRSSRQAARARGRRLSRSRRAANWRWNRVNAG